MIPSHIVDEIITELKLEHPLTMKTVSHIIDNLIHNPESFYGLLIGEIQSGKTPAQMMLTWIFSHHPSFNGGGGSVCFITKNLDSIRRDIMSKFESDLINKHIVRVCARYGIDERTALIQYGLTYNIYTATDKRGGGKTVKVMLMQKDNFSHVRHWYETDTDESSPVLFLIDEMHEMYGGSTDLIMNRGLETPKKVPNDGMLHWLKSKFQLNRRTYIIGVTATPYSPMSADPICWPTKIFHLETDAPAPGLTYYGYKDHSLKGIDIQVYNSETIIDIDGIRSILQSPRNVLKNGNTEVKLICISTHQRNEQHDAIYKLIVQEFGQLVNCLVFNQINNVPLHSWFKPSMLTADLCAYGAIIIIGRSCLAAGITIKPASPLIVTRENITYQVTGITDQFMPNSEINITSTKQLMRIIGWFPNGHQATLWIPDETLRNVYQTEIAHATSQFMDKYDPMIGPASIGKIELHTKHIKSFYSDNFYRVIQRFGLHLHVNNAAVKDKDVIPTVFQPVPPEAIADFGENTIDSYSKNTQEQHRLRRKLGFSGGKSHLLIGYSEARYKDIMRFVLLPSDTNTAAQVNGFLWGPQGHRSLIKDCQLITFPQSWNDPTRAKGINATFQLPDGTWAYLKQTKYLDHVMIPLFKDIATPTISQPNSLSKIHHLTLKMMDIIAKHSGGEQKTVRMTLRARPI